MSFLEGLQNHFANNTLIGRVITKGEDIGTAAKSAFENNVHNTMSALGTDNETLGTAATIGSFIGSGLLGSIFTGVKSYADNGIKQGLSWTQISEQHKELVEQRNALTQESLNILQETKDSYDEFDTAYYKQQIEDQLNAIKQEIDASGKKFS
ncbi:hypothetical protein IJ531_02970 [bacterium]|nr:hypothetical protein [bacterium]